MAKNADLLQGTLDLLILKAVSLGPLHGYGVLLRIQQISGERPADSARLPLSGALPPGTQGPHHVRVGRVRQQPKGALLSPDRRGRQAAAGRSQGVEPIDRGHGPRAQGSAGGSMKYVAALRSFCSALLRRSRLDREMADEFRFHLDQRVDDLVAGGTSRDDAERIARREFGNPLMLREEGREARGVRLGRRASAGPADRVPALEENARVHGGGDRVAGARHRRQHRDLQLARRGAVQESARSSARTSSMFLAHGPADRPSGSSNYPLLARYRDLTQAFRGIAAYNTRTFRVLTGDELTNVSGQYASGNYHAVVGAPIAIGRGFAADSDRDHGGAPAVVISDGYWTRRFGRDPSALGQTITVEGSPVTIVGVTAPGFTGLMSGTSVDITLPIVAQGRERAGVPDAPPTPGPAWCWLEGSRPASPPRKRSWRRTGYFNSSCRNRRTSGPARIGPTITGPPG